MLEILVDHRGLMNEDEILLAIESEEEISRRLSGMENLLGLVAHGIILNLEENEERVLSLGKLLEAKDLAIKAANKG